MKKIPFFIKYDQWSHFVGKLLVRKIKSLLGTNKATLAIIDLFLGENETHFQIKLKNNGLHLNAIPFLLSSIKNTKSMYLISNFLI